MKRNRLLLAGAAIAAAAVIVVVVVILVSPAKKDTTTTTLPKIASSLFAGVPQRGDTLGKASARVMLTVFEDPQCPFCRTWSLDTLPTVVKRYVRTGRVKLVYRGIQIIGPDSVKGLRAIYAAGEQNKLWNLSDELYRRQGAENSGWLTKALIDESANRIGLNSRAFLKASSSAGVSVALAQATREADFGGISGTPTFIVERPPSRPEQLSVTALDPATFTAALDAAIK